MFLINSIIVNAFILSLSSARKAMRMKSVLWFATVLIVLKGSSSEFFIDQQNEQSDCMDFKLEQIDSITKFRNQSIFFSSGPYHWILDKNEIPMLKNRKENFDLLNLGNRSEITLESNNQSSSTPLTINAAMNTGRLSLGVVCMMTNEFYYYSMVWPMIAFKLILD